MLIYLSMMLIWSYPEHQKHWRSTHARRSTKNIRKCNQYKSTQSIASPRRVQMAYIRQNKLPPLDYTIILLGKEVNHIFTYIIRCFCIFNELWPFTFDLHTQKSNWGCTCILIPCTFILNFIKIVKHYSSYRMETRFAYLMSYDLWPTYSEIELRLCFDTMNLHIKFH